MVYRISIGQFNIALGDFARNFKKANEFIKQASSEGSHLILLPELWSGGYDYQHFNAYKSENLEILDKLAIISKRNKTIIAGTYLIEDNGKSYNSLILHSSGNVIEHYEKLHLFSPLRENEFFSEGNATKQICLPWGETGLAICYDLRFPEIFRKYALSGVKVILICAEWPLARIEHWRTLLRARAIENQVFIVACNGVGKTGNEIMGGCSAVIDPAGNYLIETDATSEQLLTIEFEPEIIENIRENLPILKNRRTDIYG